MNRNNENKKSKDISLIFFIVLSIAICLESYNLGIGSFMDPKSGLFPLISGLLMGIFSVIKLIINLFSEEKNYGPEAARYLKRISLLAISLLAYAVLMTKLGFVISTFLLIVFLLKVIESKPLYIVLSLAVAVTGFIYLIFKTWLGIPLPVGFIGF